MVANSPQARWNARNKNKVRQIGKEWALNNKNRLINRRKKYYEENRTLILSKIKKWREENPERGRIYSRNRRARKRNSPDRHTIEDINDLLIQQDYKCNGCFQSLENYHVDHILPLSRGGSNGKDNLQILCPGCNLSKYNKTMDEWNLTKQMYGK